MLYEALGLHLPTQWNVPTTGLSNLPTRGGAPVEFYSGHCHYHLMNKQLIVDSLGNIVSLQASFLGSMNDADNFRLMERIGPRTNNDMPHGVVLLVD